MTNDHPQLKDQQPPVQTAIAERSQEEKPKPELTLPPLPGVGIDLMTLGKVLVQSGYFPTVKSISQAVVKVLLGQELGIGPITSLMNVYIVGDRPALSASLMAAQIKKSRRYDYRVPRLDEDLCEVRFFEVRAGEREEIGASVFTKTDAENAGLLRKGGSWTTYRRNMLFARAMSNGARWFCADIFGGAVYTPDELDERPERPAKPADESVTPQVGSAVEALANELARLGPMDIPAANGPEVAATHTPNPTVVTPQPTTVVPLFQDAPPVPVAGDPAKREKR